MIYRANYSGHLDTHSVKYLINYFLLGEELDQPDDWEQIREDIEEDLKIDHEKTFQKIMAQVN